MPLNIAMIAVSPDLAAVMAQHKVGGDEYNFAVYKNYAESRETQNSIAVIDIDNAGKLPESLADEQKIIVISAKNSDYKYKLQKPYHLHELFALLAKMGGEVAGNKFIQLAGFKFDYARKTLAGDNGQINLTDKEAEVINVLAASFPDAIDKNEILKRVWGYDAESIDTHTLETHMYRLRKKIGDDDFIVNDGYGYKLRNVVGKP